MNYNTFHKKNRKIQKKLIDSRNYTYQTIIKLVDIFFDKTGVVFDFGCGVGSLDFYLSKRMKHVYGYDISSDAIKIARQSAEELNIKNVSFESVVLPNFKAEKKADYIVCSEVLEHVEHDVELVRVIHQVIKKDGIAIVSTPLLDAPLYRMGLLSNFDNRVGHLRRYSPKSFSKMFTDFGFIIVDEIYVEGLLRNMLFTNKVLGFFVRFVRFPVTIIINGIDNILGRLFGYSNIYLVVRKP